jgi:hypothetical protein
MTMLPPRLSAVAVAAIAITWKSLRQTKPLSEKSTTFLDRTDLGETTAAACRYIHTYIYSLEGESKVSP